jgi:hypothetical protein
MDGLALLWFLPVGYLVTVLIEAPILLALLSRRHPPSRRLFAGLWLTACTYPVVVLVLPSIFDIAAERSIYLWVAETFAPLAECVLFTIAFPLPRPASGRDRARDLAAIVLANLASFGIGEWIAALGGWDWLFL